MRTIDPDVWFGRLAKEHWARKPTDLNVETRLRASLGDAAAEFWRHISLRGSLMVNRRFDTPTAVARNFVATSIALCLAIALVSYNVQELRSRPPLQVNAQASQTASGLRFPAVALCTNNVISKASLGKYITFLHSKKHHNESYDADYIEKNILNFGAFLTQTLPDIDVVFMDLLQQKDLAFNVSDLMYQLSPKCSTLLRSCAWAGSLVNCSQLFATRVTPLGYCCVFNSRYHPDDVNRPPWVLKQAGQSTGLIVMYTENDEDFAYVRRPALGVEALIFDGDEYPLLETGVTRLYPVQRNASMFFSLSLREIKASGELKTYSESWRQCRMREPRGPRTEWSSYSWCLLQCRRRTMAALCKCVPFFLMPGDGDVVCTPNNLPCMNKHKEKFIQLYPGEDAGPGLTEEIQDSLACHQCLPDCGRPVYDAYVASSYNFEMERKFHLGLTVGELANTSVMRFYFNSNHQSQYVVEPSLRWYEGIATIACHWVLLLTCSLVTFAELVFHFTVRWVHHFRRRTILIEEQYQPSHLSSDSEEDFDVSTLVLKERMTDCRTLDNNFEPVLQQFYF